MPFALFRIDLRHRVWICAVGCVRDSPCPKFANRTVAVGKTTNDLPTDRPRVWTLTPQAGRRPGQRASACFFPEGDGVPIRRKHRTGAAFSSLYRFRVELIEWAPIQLVSLIP
jgi:hypothetical protein